MIWLGIIGSGACVSGTNPAYTSSELVRHFKLTKPKFIFAQGHCIDQIMQAASECDIAASSIFSVGTQAHTPSIDGCRDWWTLLVHGESDWNGPPDDGSSVHDRIAVYSMTSGTTGLPKAAMIPHRSIIAQTAALAGIFNARPYQVCHLP